MKKNYLSHALMCGALLSLLISSAAQADAIMRSNAMFADTIAEIRIFEERVTVDLEIGLGDTEAFANLLPDDILKRMGREPEPWVDRIARFIAKDLVFSIDGESPLKGRMLKIGPEERVVRDAITGEPLPSGDDEPEMVVRATLEYVLPDKPEQLQIVTGQALARASIGFVAYHGSVAVNDFRYLSNAQTLSLDWEDPWYSRFANRSLLRTYAEPMAGFLYVEPYEVRKEIIIRPKDLQGWIDLGLEGRTTIPVEIQDELKQRTGEFLRERFATVIDGEAIEPELARVSFIDRSLKSSMVIDPPRELPIDSAVIGVIFVYPTVEPLPQKVEMKWDLFTDKMTRIKAAAVDQAGPLPTFLEPDFDTLVWENYLKNPELPELLAISQPPGLLARLAVYLGWFLIAATLLLLANLATAKLRGRPIPGKAWAVTAVVAVLAGGSWFLGAQSQMSANKANTVVAGLLHNLYRAFDFRAEEQVYDVLAQSVEGDLLTDTYLETRKSLELASQGGARVKVKNIELQSLEITGEADNGFTVLTSWVVSGSVGHWGHIHTRTNQYTARLQIMPVEGVWKLTDMEIQDEVRL
jgi:hypothetical protein